MSGSVLEQIERQSRYAFPQLLAYLHFHEKVFETQVEFLKTPIRAAIMRAIGEREFRHGSGTNAGSISQSIPVPRETVRRHLTWLEQHEWVVRDGGTYRIGPALLGEPLERVDELEKAADLLRSYKSDAPPGG